ncbi:hypothetical protein Nepgr_017408 [Nepenthes gracilis]|uniref:Uncharacterized protein n=1 Tax=Nepenthes gracilis TaxID=150966 RepID=A0AAD3XS49_NEPGR|nr:hypothetical protein Nepgr_017408 [Nepenthes gracilis]
MKWWLVALHASDGVVIGLSFWTGLYALNSAPAAVLSSFVAAVAGAVDLVFGSLCCKLEILDSYDSTATVGGIGSPSADCLEHRVTPGCELQMLVV